MAQLTLDKAREICTAAELQLVQASRRPAVGKLALDELKKRVGEARRLRDKWRDLSTRQRRETQRRAGARVTDVSARSELKAELFHDALQKLEAELATKSATPGAATRKTVAKKPGKQKRAGEHRQSRAATRAALSDQQEELAVKRVKKKKAAKKKSAKQSAASAGGAGSSAAASSKKMTAQKKATQAKTEAKRPVRSKAARKRLAAQDAYQAQGHQPETGQSAQQKSAQKRVEAKAKKTRILKSGLTTRTRGHVSARGKRAQGRRDSRG